MLRVWVTLQSVFLGGFAVLLLGHGLSGSDRLPQRVAATALALGLVAVLELRLRGWGGRALYRRLAESRVVLGWIEGYRPIQFAAVSAVLLLAAAERLPGWLRAALGQLREDLATEPLAETVVGWSVLGLIAAAVAALLVLFGVATIADALLGGASAADTANLVVLWNVTVAGVAGAAELTDLFSGTSALVPQGWRWWMNLLFALGIARSVLVVTVLLASDWLGLPLDAALAPKAHAARTGPVVTSLGILAAVGAFAWMEPRLGFAAAAALVAVGSHPAALLLELVSPRR